MPDIFETLSKPFLNNDTVFVLNKERPTLNSLTKADKSSFGFLDRLWIWLGWHSSCIERISILFSDAINTNNQSEYNKRQYDSIVKKLANESDISAADRIEAVACNLLFFNYQVKMHNQNLSWKTPFRRTAEKINDNFINDLFKRAEVLRMPPPPPPEKMPEPLPPVPTLWQRFTEWAWGKPKEPKAKAIDAIAGDALAESATSLTCRPVEKLAHTIASVITPDPILKLSAKNTSAPSKLPHFGLTCHFASIINFFSSLPPLIDAFAKADVQPAFSDFQKGLVPILQNQGRENREISEIEFKQLGDLSKLPNITHQQCASEDMQKIMEVFSATPGQRERFSIHQTLKWNFGHVLRQRTESYDIPGEVFNDPFNDTIHDIDITTSELLKKRPFSYKETAKIQYYLNVSVAELRKIYSTPQPGMPRIVTHQVIEKTYDSMDECLKKYFADKWLEDGCKVSVRTKATATEPSLCFQVGGIPLISQLELTNIPEVLVLRLNRDTEAGKVDSKIKVSHKVNVAGQNYVLCAAVHHESRTAHYVALQNRKGTWWKNDDRGGVSEDNVTGLLDHAFLYGYVREDIHNKMMQVH